MKKRKADFKRLCDEIVNYENSDASKKLEDLRKSMAELAVEIDDARREEGQLREQLDAVKKGLAEQKVIIKVQTALVILLKLTASVLVHWQLRLQDLKMCLDLKNKEEEVVKETENEGRYRKDYEDFDPKRIRREQESVTMKISELRTKVRLPTFKFSDCTI